MSAEGLDPEPDGDPVQGALKAVADVAEDTAQASRELAEESRRASRERAQGAPVSSSMASGQFHRILRLGEEMAKGLLAATGALRRALVRQLAAEGVRVGKISRMFGVSHQRITTLRRADRGKQVE
jgi:ribosomal protein S11